MAAGVGVSGFGATIAYNTAATATNGGTSLIDLRDITLNTMTATDVDISHHGSPSAIREYVKGMIEGGEVNCVICPTAAVLLVLQTAMKAANTYGWTVTFPNTLGALSFRGYVKGFQPVSPMDGPDPFTAVITIKVAREPTIA